jgi:small multidrug resistance family-3 protein
MQNLLWFSIAAACEIAGCYAAWMWLRLGRSG